MTNTMEALKDFLIPFVGLKEGSHDFKFVVDTTFFNEFAFSDFSSANFKIDLVFEKKPNLMNLKFTVKGTAELVCDVSNEPFHHPIESSLDLIVKFGETFNDDHDEFIILPHGSYEINVAQPIYEMIVLAVPIKKIHPGVTDGSLDTSLLKKLEELQPKAEHQINDDPRWDKLKDLL